MQVKELKDALAAFNQAMPIEVAVPERGKPHHVRQIMVAGHIDHPGEVRTDHTVHPLDIVCGHWDRKDEKGSLLSVADLVSALAPFPDAMMVRVAMPLAHQDVSHRMLDIVLVGRAAGSSGGPMVQLVTESWDFPSWVVKEIPARAAARRAARAAAE